MKEKMHMDIFGACGDDCSLCPRYAATANNDMNALSRVKELWVLLGWRKPDVRIEELKCSGCTKDNQCAYKELRDCAFKKDLENCGLCSEYPCTLVKAAFEKTEHSFHTLKNICTGEELELLTKAFRYKKTNLDKMHKYFFKN
jgi:hypothetical protein